MSEELMVLAGITKEELADRVAKHLVRELLYEDERDGDGDPISTRFAKQLKKQARLAVDRGVKRIADEYAAPQIGELLEGLFLQPTNEWGQPKSKGETLVEHVTRMAREYYSEEVDYNGKTRSEARSSYDWRKCTTRGAYFVSEYFRATMDRTMGELLKDAGGLLAGGIEAAIKESLADIAQRLKVKAEVGR